MKKKGPRYIVTDRETGQTGYLEETPGYLMGGSYVNPGWRIVWDKKEESCA